MLLYMVFYDNCEYGSKDRYIYSGQLLVTLNLIFLYKSILKY